MSETVDAIITWGCIYGYALTTFLLFTAFAFKKPRLLSKAGWLLFPAFLAHTVLFISRWTRTGYFPANGELENAITGSWFALAFTVFYIAKRRKISTVAFFTVPASLLFLGYGVMKAPNPLPLNASLKSSWLIVHVFFAQLAFGSYLVATGFAVMYLLKSGKKAETPTGLPDDALPRLAIIEENMFKFVIYGLITELIDIVAGSIWAKDLWGSYWSWDPVEVWSLVSWLQYGLAVHLRTTLGWRGRKMAWLVLFLLVSMIISYWGIDLLVQNSKHMFGVKGVQ